MKRAAILFFFVALPLFAQQPGVPPDLDAYVTKVMKETGAPGAAVAIVKDDRVIFARGYGVRELGKSEPVTTNTRFAIGSISKSFTATVLGSLVDEQKVAWDDHVTKYIPWFELYDPWVTHEYTVRDLLTHRSGLKDVAGGTIWYGTDYSREEVIRRIRMLKPVAPFRYTFAYQNWAYLVAGEVAHAAAGRTWDDLVRERILGPLAMTSTTTSIPLLNTDIASPHSEVEGRLRVVPHRSYENVGPAGSIYSSVVDMAQYVRLHLNRGSVGATRIYSEAVAKQMFSPQMLYQVPLPDAPKDLPFIHTHYSAYGFGWFLRDYRGQAMVEHSGGVDGFAALVTMFPDQHVGIVVLSNYEGPMITLVSRRLADFYLGAPAFDWLEWFLPRLAARKKSQAEEAAKVEASRALNARPSLPLDGYAGTYHDPMIGDATVTNENGKLVLRFAHTPTFIADLEPWHYDTFRTHWRDPMVPKGFLTFTLNSKGAVDRMIFDQHPLLDADLAELDFRRVNIDEKQQH